MGKLNLVIDFNNMIMRSMHRCVYSEIGQISGFNTKEECAVFARKLTMDIISIIKTFMPATVIFACDSRDPWRKAIFDDIPDYEYKGNRKKDESINIDNVFATAKDVRNIFSKYNVIESEIDHAEADDIAAMWVEKKAFENEDVILVTSDKDWRQLISYNGKNFCICYNPIQNKNVVRLFVPENFSKILTGEEAVKTDIFFTNFNQNIESVKQAVLANHLTVTVEDPNQIVLEKVMCGDSSDNIPAIYEYYKNGKKTRVTPLKCSMICEKLDNSHTIKDLQNHINDGSLKDTISAVMKKEIDEFDMNERFLRQRKLVQLDSILFPPEIVNKFSELYPGDTPCISYDKFKMTEILKNTPYLDEHYMKTARESDVFKDLKSLEKIFIQPKLF